MSKKRIVERELSSATKWQYLETKQTIENFDFTLLTTCSKNHSNRSSNTNDLRVTYIHTYIITNLLLYFLKIDKG